MNKKILVLVILFFALVGTGAFALAKWNANKTEPAVYKAQAGAVSGESTASAKPAWLKRCSEPKEAGAAKHCEAFQTLIIRESQQRFLEIAVSSRKEGEWVAAVLAPLGISLKKGGLIQIEGEDTAEQFAFDECGSNGCFARFAIKPDFFTRLKRAQAVFIGFYNAEGKLIQVKLPMSGFEQALQAL